MHNKNLLRKLEVKKWTLGDFQESQRVVSQEHSDRTIGIISGCGRSGTTLARVILDSHSQVYAGLESLLFLPIPITAAVLSKKFDIPCEDIENQLSGAKSKFQFIEWFISEVLRKNSKSLFVDKTARNIHVLEDIWRVYPNALVVHVVRDPVDTINSLKTHPKRMLNNGKVKATGIEHDIDDCIARWQLASQEALKHKGKSNFHIVEYEDLVMNTEKTIKEVCEFLGVAFEPIMLDFTAQNLKHTREPLRGFIQNIEAIEPLSTKAIGKGYDNLGEPDIMKIREKTGRAYEGLKYTSPVILQNDLVLRILKENNLIIREGVVDSLRLHHETSLVQPPKVYLQRPGAHTADRIISMPVYAFGNVQSAGMKWIGSHPENHDVGLQRANAIICLNHILTNAPVAILDGTEISSERTFWMGVLGIEKFIGSPRNVSIIGMGKLGQMYANRLRTFFPSIKQIKCYSESGKHIYINRVQDDGIEACDSWEKALDDSDVVITTTAKGEPYIQDIHLPTTVKCIINLSLMDFDIDVFENSQVVVDDFGQCSQAKKVFKRGLEQGRIKKEEVIEFGNILFGGIKVEETKRILFNPLGMGIEDLCCAKRIYDIATRQYRNQLLHL